MPSAKSEKKEPVEPKNVLVVDDDQDALESIQAIIHQRLGNVNVLVADSAEAAREVLATNTVHLILSDYQMPGANGVQFLTAIRDQNNPIPRILMTAYPRQGLANQAQELADITAFAVKPLQEDQLVSLIENMLGRRKSKTRKTA